MDLNNDPISQCVTEITVAWLKTQKRNKSAKEVEEFIGKIGQKLRNINNIDTRLPKNREEMIKFLKPKMKKNAGKRI